MLLLSLLLLLFSESVWVLFVLGGSLYEKISKQNDLFPEEVSF